MRKGKVNLPKGPSASSDLLPSLTEDTKLLRLIFTSEGGVSEDTKVLCALSNSDPEFEI